MRAALAALLAWGLPSLALACPVCFDANEANRDAYVGTTVLLSLLPLAFIGAVALVLRARARARTNSPHETSRIDQVPKGEFSICNVPDDAR